ncbi:MAG: helix-turn-helix transcriptional regulator, partial [Deltaproteobacteria bacterium]|nr:helix-turn-helix transcriptional regulator [Deltaproteobacteria bacterium]
MAGENDGQRVSKDQMTGVTHDTRPEADFLAGVTAVAAEPEGAPPGEELTVGQRVRLIREQKGLTLADLAQRTGLDEQVLSEIEEESVSPPLGLLVRLGKALEMKFGTLIASGEDRPYTVVRVAERRKMSRYASQRGTRYG